MAKMIFLNLPVHDVAKATAFHEAMGFSLNPGFSNDDASMLAVSDTIHIMLLSRSFFSTFTKKAIGDARKEAQVAICLSAESREEVDATIDRAAAAGGYIHPDGLQDHGFMYGRSYEDLDGHHFEIMWMDPEMAAKGPHADEAVPA